MKEVVNTLPSQQVQLFERLADRVVGLGFALPAVLFLETMRPVNFVGSAGHACSFSRCCAPSLLCDYDLCNRYFNDARRLATLLTSLRPWCNELWHKNVNASAKLHLKLKNLHAKQRNANRDDTRTRRLTTQTRNHRFFFAFGIMPNVLL